MRCKHGHVVITETICFRTLRCCGCQDRTCRALYQPLTDLLYLGHAAFDDCGPAITNLKNNGWSSEAAQ